MDACDFNKTGRHVAQKIMYNRAIYFAKKNIKPSHFHNIREKQVFDSHSKENHFVVSKMLNFLNHIFLLKLKILVLSYSTLTILC